MSVHFAHLLRLYWGTEWSCCTIAKWHLEWGREREKKKTQCNTSDEEGTTNCHCNLCVQVARDVCRFRLFLMAFFSFSFSLSMSMSLSFSILLTVRFRLALYKANLLQSSIRIREKEKEIKDADYGCCFTIAEYMHMCHTEQFKVNWTTLSSTNTGREKSEREERNDEFTGHSVELNRGESTDHREDNSHKNKWVFAAFDTRRKEKERGFVLGVFVVDALCQSLLWHWQ